MPEINLLPEEERKEVAQAKLKRKIAIYSFAALVITIVISFMIFGYWLTLKRTDDRLSLQISNLTSQIQQLSNVENLARTLKTKLAAISGISQKSQNFENLLSDVAQITPPGVTLSDLTVSDQNLITLAGTANSAPEFSGFVTTILKPGVTAADFSNVTVESLTRDDAGIYKFTISAKLKR